MDAVHLASSRQVHLSFNGVIVDIGTHATRQFLCPPIEIRFATLVAAAQPIFDCPPQAFPDGKLHHRLLPGPVPHRGKLRVHEFIDQDPLDWSFRTEFLNDRFTHAAVDRNLLGIYYRPQRPWRASQPTRRAKNFAGSFFRTDVIDGHSLLSCRDSNPNSFSIPLSAQREKGSLLPGIESCIWVSLDVYERGGWRQCMRPSLCEIFWAARTMRIGRGIRGPESVH